ncbi:Oidioi.mRNA.OKI2018_I69.chr1.g1461.t1.cds [Oikopleura dioica]|uniref:Oidioi.mRNA.OKI2018_I69.chr1.g1461.t1.cds n=1 Tax=Oikopleura dioica TaxID=34765 RepID=A0ABN7SMZ3_OIKDI|nr:Oidioi.mRNA.OKI2018_I69.chr1.g1461.t1.cds [Oikopleura dioica]
MRNIDLETTNIYHALLFGKNWWNFLQKIAPKVPTTINQELKDDLLKCNTSMLEVRFGPKPTRADLPKIEEFLNIDLYLLYGGKYSPLGISYRPSRTAEVLSIRNVLEKYESGHTNNEHVDRPLVILQSARPYFHTLGPFYVIPTRKVAEERDRDWINLWRAIVKYRWPKLNKTEQDEKIVEVKREMCIDDREMFSIADGVFQRIRTRYQLPIRLFIGKIVNDNVNNKVCFYATKPILGKNPLNLLVGSYTPDEFEIEFKKFAGVSYNELRRNPWRNPVLAADGEYQRERRLDADRGFAANVIDEGDVDAAGLVEGATYETDDNDNESVVLDEGEFEEYDGGLGANPFIDSMAAEDDCNSDGTDDCDGYDSYDEREDDAVYRPIRNLAALVPNVFSDNTLCRILHRGEVIDMPVCPTKNCLYSHQKASYMRAHVKIAQPRHPAEFVNQFLDPVLLTLSKN